MKINLLSSIALCFTIVSPPAFGYTSVTPLAVHNRLVANDTLLILDVREWSEYTTDGHIAEPSANHLPLTPANMPWTTNVLRANHARLPRNIDIIVHCRSGARSTAASTFLDSLGFTRIFNMTGGFLAWTYEKRTGGFGDHSGHWVRSAITAPDTVKHDSAVIAFFPGSINGIDSLYCEVHYAYGKQPIPGDAPVSAIAGLFRITALDRFGMSLFNNDSLLITTTASDSVSIFFIPRSKTAGVPLPNLEQIGGTALAGPGQWKPVGFAYNPPVFYCNGGILRRWYNVTGQLPQAVRKYPARSSIALFTIGVTGPSAVFDLCGRLTAGRVASGTAAGCFIFSKKYGRRNSASIVSTRSR